MTFLAATSSDHYHSSYGSRFRASSTGELKTLACRTATSLCLWLRQLWIKRHLTLRASHLRLHGSLRVGRVKCLSPLQFVLPVRLSCTQPLPSGSTLIETCPCSWISGPMSSDGSSSIPLLSLGQESSFGRKVTQLMLVRRKQMNLFTRFLKSTQRLMKSSWLCLWSGVESRRKRGSLEPITQPQLRSTSLWVAEVSKELHLMTSGRTSLKCSRSTSKMSRSRNRWHGRHLGDSQQDQLVRWSWSIQTTKDWSCHPSWQTLSSWLSRFSARMTMRPRLPVKHMSWLVNLRKQASELQ